MSSFERRYLVIAIVGLILQIVGFVTDFHQPREAIPATPAIVKIDR